MELLIKVITHTLNVVPEYFYAKCSNLYLERTYRETRVLFVFLMMYTRNSWHAVNDTLIPPLLSIRVMYTNVYV